MRVTENKFMVGARSLHLLVRRHHRIPTSTQSDRPKTGLVLWRRLQHDLRSPREANLWPHDWDWLWDHSPLAQWREPFVCPIEPSRHDSATAYGRAADSSEIAPDCSAVRWYAVGTSQDSLSRLVSSDAPMRQRLLSRSRRATTTIETPKNRARARQGAACDVRV